VGVSEDPLAMLRALGSVAELRATAHATPGAPRLKLNSHVHVPPNFSAFTTVTEALDLAVAQDVRVLGTSNYYDYRLVLAMGGIPCYTIVADGMQPISAFEGPVEQLIASVKERGTYCSELIPNRNTPEIVEQYTRALRSAGMIVLAGTEHNTLPMPALNHASARSLH
jgi:hypothetical protein